MNSHTGLILKLRPLEKLSTQWGFCERKGPWLVLRVARGRTVVSSWSVLEAPLFFGFINDLPRVVKSKCILYAGNLKSRRIIGDPEDRSHRRAWALSRAGRKHGIYAGRSSEDVGHRGTPFRVLCHD